MLTRCRRAVFESSTRPRTKRGIHLGRLRERHGRAREGVLPQHGLEAGDEGDLRVAHAVLGQAHAVPGVGPGGLQVDGPLEFGGRVVVVRLAAELAQPEREEAELEVDEGVVAVRLGEIDHAALDARAARSNPRSRPASRGSAPDRRARSGAWACRPEGTRATISATASCARREPGRSHQRDPHAGHPEGPRRLPAEAGGGGAGFAIGDAVARAADHTRSQRSRARSSRIARSPSATAWA